MGSMSGPLYVDGILTRGLGRPPGGLEFFVNTNSASAARNADRPWFNVAQSDRQRVESTGGKTVFDNLQGAIDACVSSRGDRITIARGTETVTEAVNFNKTGITVVVQDFGGHQKAMGEFTALLADAAFTDGPVAIFTAPCTVIGLGFVGRDTGTTFFSGASALIGGLATASPFGVHLYRCRFPKWNLAARIGLAIEGSSDCLIEDCTFEGVGSDLEAGIYMQGATANLEIANNRFVDCDYAMVFGAITGGGPGPDLDFHGNRVIGADSKGINTAAQSGRGIIWNNYFNTDQGAATFDRTTDQLDTQGFQLIGNYYKDESTGPT